MAKQRSFVTLKDVARAAGVSASTVSRVLHGKGERWISNATKERVRQIARELGYLPDLNARILRKGSNQLVGLLMAHLKGWLPAFLVDQLSLELNRKGFRTAFCIAGRSPKQERAFVEELYAQHARALVVVSYFWEDLPEWVESVTSPEFQVLFLSPPAAPSAHLLVPDFYAAARQLVAHLAALGHKRIGLIHPHHVVRSITDFREGYRQALADLRLPCPRRWCISAERSPKGGFVACSDLLHRAPELTALVCTNDELAFGALQAAFRLGRKVPEDLSVVGFDDITAAAFYQPPLTTIRIPYDQLVQQAGEVLLSFLKQPDTPLVKKTFPGELVVRESTAPPAKVASNLEVVR